MDEVRANIRELENMCFLHVRSQVFCKMWVLTCCEAGCLFFTFVARGKRISVSLALVPAIPDILPAIECTAQRARLCFLTGWSSSATNATGLSLLEPACQLHSGHFLETAAP